MRSLRRLARDTRLDRDVAIKVMPPAVAQDPERLARFEREAKLLGALNHPNVAQTYGVEESAGAPLAGVAVRRQDAVLESGREDFVLRGK
jgi:serine/threonine protein kinase